MAMIHLRTITKRLQSSVITLYARTAARVVSYLHVEHASPLWFRRGQSLIMLATLLSALAWLNFLYALFDAAFLGQIRLTDSVLRYWLLNILYLIGPALCIQWAKRGQVRLSAWVLVVVTASLIVASALFVDFTYWSQNMMGTLLVVIALSAGLLGGRAALGTTIGLIVLQTILIKTFDPLLPPYVLGSFVLADATMFLVMWAIIVPYEGVVKSGERTLSTSQRQPAPYKHGAMVSEFLRQEAQETSLTMRAALSVIEDHDGRHLSQPSLEALDRLHMTLRQMSERGDDLLAFLPIDLITANLEAAPFTPGLAVAGVEREYGGRAAHAGCQLVVDVADGLPAQATGSAWWVRRAVGRLIDYLLSQGAQGAIYLRARSSGRDAWSIDISGSGLDDFEAIKPVAIELRKPHSGPAYRVALPFELMVTRNLIHAMGGTLWAATCPNKSLKVTIRLPVTPHKSAGNASRRSGCGEPDRSPPA